MSLGLPSPAGRPALVRLAGRMLPWMAFAACLLWVLGVPDLSRTLPAYSDSLEITTGMTWFGEALTQHRSLLVDPLNYFPEGWRVGSHPGGAILFALLWPLSLLNGAALAYNLAYIGSHVLAYQGARLAARFYLRPWTGTFAALAFTFWGLRWDLAQRGLLSLLLASAMLPWMMVGAERAYRSRSRRWRWLAAAGGFWAAAIMFSLYFAFIGGIMLGLWFVFAPAHPPTGGTGELEGARSHSLPPWRERLLAAVVAGSVAVLVSLPWLYLNWRENALADPPFFSILEANFSGASLNSLVVPSISHPWLGAWARTLYGGQPIDPSAANFGIAGSLAALAGAALAWRRREWRPILALVAGSLVVSLGLTLQWSNETVSLSGAGVLQGGLRAFNELVWRLGHALKPGFFVTDAAPAPFRDALPLPALILSVLLPFMERGRVFVRYALAASLGLYLLAGLALDSLRRGWQVALVAGLLLFELVPARLEVVPYPPAGHPAFDWLAQQSIPGEGIVNVFAAHPNTLILSIHSYNLLATLYHRQPTVAGSSGVLPRHADVLREWLATHEYPFADPDFQPILRSYRVRYIVLEMLSPWEAGIWEQAQSVAGIRPVGCYPPPGGVTPWPWPICIAELLPAPATAANLLLHQGWSGMEAWGVWMDATAARAQRVLTARAAQQLSFSAFPMCLPGQHQTLAVEVNGVPVASHEWQDCEPWSTSVIVPAAGLRTGFNDLDFRAAYASAPPNPAGGPSTETRSLAVGFSLLRMDAAPGP